MAADDEDAGRPRWTFLTNHAHVLLCIAQDPGRSLREVALAVGITERATQSIVADLEAGGYLERSRVGRRNAYALHPERPLRHPLEHDHAVGELLDLLGGSLTGIAGDGTDASSARSQRGSRRRSGRATLTA